MLENMGKVLYVY